MHTTLWAYLGGVSLNSRTWDVARTTSLVKNKTRKIFNFFSCSDNCFRPVIKCEI